MAKVRNMTNDTVVDFHTGRVAGPDEVITIPDEWAASYENHPVWRVESAPTSRKKADTPADDATEEVTE